MLLHPFFSAALNGLQTSNKWNYLMQMMFDDIIQI